MRNRDSLLGRPRPAERLTKEQIAALDKETSTPAAPPAPTKPTAPPARQQTKPTANISRRNPAQSRQQSPQRRRTAQ